MAVAATFRQVSFLESLGYEGDATVMSKKAASAKISELIAARDASRAAERKAKLAALPEAKPGYYLAPGDDVFHVVISRTSGKPYAKKLNTYSGKWVYAPGAAGRLASFDPLTAEEAARLGRLHGHCIICWSELDDPQSVAYGIGPVCYKKITGVTRPKLSEDEIAARLAGTAEFAEAVAA